MSRFAEIDLSQLPAPDVVEALEFETVLAGMRADLLVRMPELSDALGLESDPLSKLLEAASYLALLLRQRVNDAARAVMLAYATGSDLDQLAALLGVARLTLVAADTEAVPPVEAVMESDAALRRRAQLALEGYTSAGSVGAYEFHARSADGRVADVSVVSPNSGVVQLTILSSLGDGTPAGDLIAAVVDAVNADEVRPLCDNVVVVAPTIVPYAITADLEIPVGPDASLVLAAAQTAVEAYAAEVHALGATVALSGLHAALHQAGVRRVLLTQPVADIQTEVTEAPYCTGITITTSEPA